MRFSPAGFFTQCDPIFVKYRNIQVLEERSVFNTDHIAVKIANSIPILKNSVLFQSN